MGNIGEVKLKGWPVDIPQRTLRWHVPGGTTARGSGPMFTRGVTLHLCATGHEQPGTRATIGSPGYGSSRAWVCVVALN